MTISVGDADQKEVAALLPVLRSIKGDAGRATFSLGGTPGLESSSASFESSVGTVAIHSRAGTTVVFVEPSTATIRALAHLEIGDPELRPALQFVIDDARNAPRRSSSVSRDDVVARLTRAIPRVEAHLSRNPAIAAAAETELEATVEAMAAWASARGEDMHSFIDLHAPDGSHPHHCEWGAEFRTDPSSDPTSSIDAWAGRRLVPMFDTTTLREKQTLTMMMQGAHRQGRCGMSVVDALRIISRHPDIPS